MSLDLEPPTRRRAVLEPINQSRGKQRAFKPTLVISYPSQVPITSMTAITEHTNQKRVNPLALMLTQDTMSMAMQ